MTVLIYLITEDFEKPLKINAHLIENLWFSRSHITPILILKIGYQRFVAVSVSMGLEQVHSKRMCFPNELSKNTIKYIKNGVVLKVNQNSQIYKTNNTHHLRASVFTNYI